MSNRNDSKSSGEDALDSRIRTIESDRRSLPARAICVSPVSPRNRARNDLLIEITAVLRNTLIVLLCLGVPAPGLASWRHPRPSGSHSAVHGEAAAAPTAGKTAIPLAERAFRDGVSRSLAVFNAEHRGMTAALERVDLRQEQEESDDEVACIADAKLRSEAAISTACNTDDAVACETAKRVAEATLQAEMIKCQQDTKRAAPSEHSSTHEDEVRALRDTQRMGNWMGVLAGVIGIAITAVIVFLEEDE